MSFRRFAMTEDVLEESEFFDCVVLAARLASGLESTDASELRRTLLADVSEANSLAPTFEESFIAERVRADVEVEAIDESAAASEWSGVEATASIDANSAAENEVPAAVAICAERT